MPVTGTEVNPVGKVIAPVRGTVVARETIVKDKEEGPVEDPTEITAPRAEKAPGAVVEDRPEDVVTKIPGRTRRIENARPGGAADRATAAVAAEEIAAVAAGSAAEAVKGVDTSKKATPARMDVSASSRTVSRTCDLEAEIRSLEVSHLRRGEVTLRRRRMIGMRIVMAENAGAQECRVRLVIPATPSDFALFPRFDKTEPIEK